MCIVCNCARGDKATAIYDGVDLASNFLHSFDKARHAMQEAADDMIRIMHLHPDNKKQYD